MRANKFKDKIGIRVNAYSYYGSDRLTKGDGAYLLDSYFYFSPKKENLLQRIYKYFSISPDHLCIQKTADGKSMFEPSVTLDQMIGHRIYFSNANALKKCFKTVLEGYDLKDAFTEENITLDDLVIRAKHLENKS